MQIEYPLILLYKDVSVHFIYSLDMARGAFSIGILVLHINRMIAQTQAGSLGPWVEWLGVGVDYFFVLSGFLMFYLHSQDAGSMRGVARFAIKRVARLYPMFWLALALSIALIPLSSSMTFPPVADIIKHIFLITPNMTPEGFGRILGVAWTLEMELKFYAIFAISLLFANRVPKLGWPLIAIGLAIWSPYAILFLSGITAAYLVKKQGVLRFKRPGLVLIGSAITIIAVQASVFPVYLEKMCFGLSVGLFILACLNVEGRDPVRVKNAPFIFALIGSVSYSVYLLHIPLSLIVFTVIKRSPWIDAVPGAVWVVVTSLIVWLVAAAISIKVEKPMNRFLQSKINQRFPSSRAKVVQAEGVSA